MPSDFNPARPVLTVNRLKAAAGRNNIIFNSLFKFANNTLKDLFIAYLGGVDDVSNLVTRETDGATCKRGTAVVSTLDESVTVTFDTPFETDPTFVLHSSIFGDGQPEDPPIIYRWDNHPSGRRFGIVFKLSAAAENSGSFTWSVQL